MVITVESVQHHQHHFHMNMCPILYTAFEMLPYAPLPDFRVRANFPYTATGVDYFGPILVKNIFGQSKEIFKLHMVLYTCASSRALHLDVVDQLCGFCSQFETLHQSIWHI